MFCCHSQKSKQDTLKNRIPLYSLEDWIVLLKEPFNKADQSVISHNIRFNFPVELRSQIWYWLTSDNLKHINYQELPLFSSPYVEQQVALVKHNKPEQLSRILFKYRSYNQYLGYSGGTNYIVGAILDQVEQEEIAFSIFSQIMTVEKFVIVSHLDTRLFYALNERIKKELPLIFKQMKDHKAHPQICFEVDIITLFQRYRKQFALRIIDIFMIDKEEIIFTIYIKLLQLQQSEILAFSHSEPLIAYLQNNLVDNALDKLDNQSDLLKQLLSII